MRYVVFADILSLQLRYQGLEWVKSKSKQPIELFFMLRPLEDVVVIFNVYFQTHNTE